MSKPPISPIPIYTDEGMWGNVIQSIGNSISQALEIFSTANFQKLESTAGTLKRSLMSFDKINRLSAKSGSSKRSFLEDFLKAMQDKGLAANMQGMAGSVARWLQSLGIDLSAVDRVLIRTRDTMETMPDTLKRLMQPAVQLVGELTGFPSAVERTREALSKLDISYIFTAGLMQKLMWSARDAGNGIRQGFEGLDDFFKSRVTGPVGEAFDSIFDALPSGAELAWRRTREVFSDTADYFKNTFREAWSGVLAVFSHTEPTFSGVVGSVVSSMKNVMNRLISGINQAIVEPFSGLNNAFTKLKNFTVNGVQPFKNLNFSVSMPSIPLLASGAVLPANKPFLAMVGDQKHGTNIEAPLATIQEAVANVMGEVVEAEMAGHNATVSVLRQILEAVLGIHLDEYTLGRALEGYTARKTVMTGGF